MQSAFREAMDDDFNTPVAIAELQRLKSDVNKLLEPGSFNGGAESAPERNFGRLAVVWDCFSWISGVQYGGTGALRLSDR